VGWAPELQLQFHFGRFTTENWLRYVRTGLDVDLFSSARPKSFRLHGDIDLWEYVGGLRYNLRTDWVQPFLRLGYGWSWYRLTEVAVEGTPIAHPTGTWVNRPSLAPPANLFPNEWQAGIGIELIPTLRWRTLHPFDLSVKLDATYTLQSVDVNLAPQNSLGLKPPSPGTHRWGIGLAAIGSL
jgi:hypothetical protein